MIKFLKTKEFKIEHHLAPTQLIEMRKVTTASILIFHFLYLTPHSYSSPTNTQLKHPVFEKRAPESPEDLLAIEKQVRSVLQTSKKATVCIQGNGSGSGVIISEE